MNRVGDKYVFMWHWAEFKLIISISFLQARCPHYKKRPIISTSPYIRRSVIEAKKKKKKRESGGEFSQSNVTQIYGHIARIPSQTLQHERRYPKS